MIELLFFVFIVFCCGSVIIVPLVILYATLAWPTWVREAKERFKLK